MTRRCVKRLDTPCRRFVARLGFTLIEMMVAVALMAIIVGIAAKVFAECSELFSVTTARVEIQQNGRVMMDSIERDLRGAFLRSGTEAGDFTGTGTEMTFVTSSARYEDGGWSKSKKILYYYDSGQKALRTWQSRYLDGTGSADTDLGFNVLSVSFLYLTSGGASSSTWDGSSGLPTAVKVQLLLTDALEREKQTLVRIIHLG